MSTRRVWISAIRCGSWAVLASVSSASRSTSALSTTPIRLSGPSGASCASEPTRQRGGIVIVPLSVASSPRIARNSVDLPVPLGPTRPTREPGTICTEPWSIRSRPASRIEMSVMESMRGCHRSRAQTQWDRATKYLRPTVAMAVFVLASAPWESALLQPAQLIEELAQPGRQVGTLRPQILLQPFAHGIADRPAGLVVHLLAAIGFGANHGGFRCFGLL